MMRSEIDFLYEVAPDTLEFISNEASVQVFPFLRNFVYGVIFNSNRDIFRDRRVRQAVNYAVDRAAIVEQVFKGHALVANGPTWPQHWAHDSGVQKFSYDPPRAVALLDSANVPVVDRRVATNRPPSRLHFTCILPENFAVWERMALLVQRNLSEIGIDMKLETMPFDTFTKRVISKDFEAAFSELINGRAAVRPYTFWYSSSKQNFFGYRSSMVDSSLDAIRGASSDEAYREAFRRFQLEMVEDPPAIFLALGENTRAVSRRFQVQSPLGSDILYTIANWRISGGPLGTSN
jgi:peptide/nickel transport system substrate-binding protein